MIQNNGPTDNSQNAWKNKSNLIPLLIAISILIGLICFFFFEYERDNQYLSMDGRDSKGKEVSGPQPQDLDLSSNANANSSATIERLSTDVPSAKEMEPQKDNSSSGQVVVNVINNNGNNNKVGETGTLPQEDPEENEKEERLSRLYNPEDPNPVYSWKEEEKVKAPVRYHQAVLEYLNAQEAKIKTSRNSVGVTMRIWEKELDDLRLKVKGNEAALRNAAKVYREAKVKNEWPVSFAYQTFQEEAFSLEILDLSQKYQRSKNEEVRIENGYNMLVDSIRKYDKELELFSEQIRRFSKNLELIRSAGLTEKSLESIKEMDTAFAESEEALSTIMRDFGNDLFPSIANDKYEAELNLDEILEKYAPVNK